jgi:hypothetical protein
MRLRIVILVSTQQSSTMSNPTNRPPEFITTPFSTLSACGAVTSSVNRANCSPAPPVFGPNGDLIRAEKGENAENSCDLAAELFTTAAQSVVKNSAPRSGRGWAGRPILSFHCVASVCRDD